MKPELSERLFVESLVASSIDNKKISVGNITDVERLTGDASTRRYYRVAVSNDYYVVCIDNPIKEKAHSDFFEIQSLFSSEGVSVPQIYDYIPEKGYYLEEDLGDITLLQFLATVDDETAEFEIYKKVIDELVLIHKIDVTKSRKNPCGNRFFDFDKLYSEIEFTNTYFISELMKQDILVEDEKIISKSFSSICKNLANEETVTTHRDYHSRNIMMSSGNVKIIDFQDARMGIPQYDLVSLLEDCYYSLTRNNKFKLRKYYWETFLEARKAQKSYEQFEYFYDLAKIQRVYKAIGSFSYIYSTRRDERYLKYIGFGFERLRRCLMKYPEFSSLRKTLSKIYYEY